jgi:diacylglycerol O-acyltransferase
LRSVIQRDRRLTRNCATSIRPDTESARASWVYTARVMVGADPLSRDDVARLHMERRDNPMTITALVSLRGALTLAELDAVVRARLLTRPRFCERVVEHTVAGPRWEPDDAFDLRAHVHHVALPSPGDRGALEELLGDLASTALDPRIPLWQMHLVDNVGEGSALVVRVHHVIADGLALVDVLLALTDEGPRGWTPPAPVVPPRNGRLAALAPVAGFASLVLSGAEPATALTAHHGAHKHLAWTRGFDLAALKRVARSRGVGVTAAILALVTGALRRALMARQTVDDSLVVRAMVPLSVRASGERASSGNRYASVFVGLPVGIDDGDERLAEVARRLGRVRVAGGLSLGRALVRIAARVGAPVERIGVSVLSRRASLVVSNVPGPREGGHLDGRPITSVVAFAPVTGELGLGVTFFGYGSRVSVGVASGLEAPSLAREVVDGIARECESLGV